MAVNRLRECANAIAKAIGGLSMSTRANVLGHSEVQKSTAETHVAVAAEALRFELVAASGKGSNGSN